MTTPNENYCTEYQVKHRTYIELFNDRINIAVSIVIKQYPHAELYEVEGVALGGPTKDPTKIDHINVVFHNVNETTVMINETSPGNFNPPILIGHPWLDDIKIHWPMDLDHANRLKEEAGFTNPYKTVTLRNPLGPKPGNPLLIFGDGSSQSIIVDTVTGNVTIGK
ncbi:25990_t:CDS:2 [Gigaspora rosea]|nr:25990_t:CDS:2 [Gigaspora rosea]